MTITLAVHRVEHTHFVDDRTNMREQIADPCSALTVFLEGVPWLNEEPVKLTRFIEPPRGRNGLAMIGD